MKKFLKKLGRRRRLERDLEDELRFHLDMKTDATGDEWQARRRLGNVGTIKESCRELWTFARIETWWQDVRYALRTLRRSPGLVLAAIVALALGIGANTTVFTVVNTALSFDIGVEHVDRVVQMSIDPAHEPLFTQSYFNLPEIRSRIKSLETVAAYSFGPVNVSDRSALPERFFAAQMSAAGFTIMGRQALLGRTYTADDERPGAAAVIVLSYRVWQDRYGRDPSVLGRTIRVDDVPRTIIGIMPPGSRFPEEAEVWMPISATHDGPPPILIGLLADGIKLPAARAELDSLARALADKAPTTFKGLTVRVRSILEINGVYESRSVLIVMLVAVSFVLLIACADVANLLLARAAARTREISIRIAIGAGRVRIIRQLLVESLLLSSAGGLFGWLVARFGLGWFDHVVSKGTRPVRTDFSMSPRVFLYLVAISVGTGIICGLAPALRLARTDIIDTIKDGGQGAGGGARGRRLSGVLVILQMALCVVLLTGAGLMIRSSLKVYGAPLVVNPANVLTVHINLSEAKYRTPAEVVRFHDQLKARLEALPGVESTAVTSDLPTAGWREFAFETDRVRKTDSDQTLRTAGLLVSADYFRVIQVQPRLGRVFASSDGRPGFASVIVNESFVEKYWPGEDPLGKRIRLTAAGQPWMTVTGVVPDIPQNFPRQLEDEPLIYLPYTQAPLREAFVVARTRVPPESLGEAFRRETQALDENLPLYDVRTLVDRIALTRLDVKLMNTLFTTFALIALVLACVGLYGVIAHSVSQRVREIGIRMALGGSTREIVTIVFAQALRQITVGLALGLPAAFAITRLLGGALVGISPGDPITYGGVIVVLVVAGVLGCAIPARRAIRVDPAITLRAD